MLAQALAPHAVLRWQPRSLIDIALATCLKLRSDFYFVASFAAAGASAVSHHGCVCLNLCGANRYQCTGLLCLQATRTMSPSSQHIGAHLRWSSAVSTSGSTGSVFLVTSAFASKRDTSSWAARHRERGTSQRLTTAAPDPDSLGTGLRSARLGCRT